jgi:myo-inositol-1(or 4)-monophosphatase
MRQACLKVATDAAKLGAAVMLDKLGADVVKTKANTRDLLTEVDPEVQRIIESAVSNAFPTHGFLGEESVPGGWEAGSEAIATLLETGPDWLWIVDPIDGTTNFVHGMPVSFFNICTGDGDSTDGVFCSLQLSAISIGVAYKGELQVGVIMDPFAGEIFSACLGGGAHVNFAPMRVGEEATGEEAVVVTGYGALAESADAMIKGMKVRVISQSPSLPSVRVHIIKYPNTNQLLTFTYVLQALTDYPVRSVRMLGSAAIMLAWVAAGRLTAYFECDLNAWDTAAGALLVREAGGQMTDLVTGEEYNLQTR